MQRDEQRLAEFERKTEAPMMLLALLMIPLLLLPFVYDISPAAERLVQTTDWLIWAAFAVELTIKTWLAPSRRRYLRSHWYEVAFVLLPFLRPLRLARAGRLLRLTRMGFAAGRFSSDARRIAGRKSVSYTLAGAGLLCVLLAGATTLAERHAQNGTIKDFTDGLWWAATTITTVGYGDFSPVTPAGRGLAVALMFIGISSFGVITASIAAFLVEEEDERWRSELTEQLSRIEIQLENLESTRVRDRAEE